MKNIVVTLLIAAVTLCCPRLPRVQLKHPMVQGG